MKSLLSILFEILVSFVMACGLICWIYLIADVAATHVLRQHEATHHSHPEVAKPPVKA